jgi:hypothetical protein
MGINRRAAVRTSAFGNAILPHEPETDKFIDLENTHRF